MRRIGAALFVMIVSAALVRAQGGPVEVLVMSRAVPANAGPGAVTAADVMEVAVFKELQRLFPCASVTSSSSIKTYLEFQKQRQLLSSDADGSLDAVAGALGAQYLFSLSVTELGGGNLAMKGSLMNAATGQAISMKTGTATEDRAIRGGEAAWLARQVVQGLSGVSRFAKDKCNPTNRWTGIIAYHAAEHSESTEEGGSRVKITLSRGSSYDALIRIGWTGEPKARVTATKSVRSEAVGTGRADCSTSSGLGNRVENYKSTGYTDQTVAESLAEETVTASATVTIRGGRIQLHVGTPTIEGKTRITESKHFDGGCDKPTSSTSTAEGEFSAWGIDITAEQAAGRDENEQSGTFTSKDGATLTWKLARTPMRP